MEQAFGRIVEIKGALMEPANRMWYGVPTIACTAHGKLWGGWYTGGSDEPSFFNYLVVASSEDGGLTWKEHFAISSLGEEKLHVVDHQLWMDPDHRLWVFWSIRNWKLSPSSPEHMHLYAMICENPDDAQFHFSAPRLIGSGCVRRQPTVLKDGRWLVPAYRQEIDSYTYLETRDHGQTFQPKTAARKRLSYYDESMIVEHLDGHLALYARCAFDHGYMLECDSEDGGNTWGEEKSTVIPNPGSRFFVQRLPSGRLLMIFNDYNQGHYIRTNMTAALSEDDGKTWPHKLLDPRLDVSYPDAAVSPDGLIYIVHDRWRCGAGEVLISRLREEDLLAGHFVSPDSYWNQLIVKKPTVPALGKNFQEAITAYDQKCFKPFIDWVLANTIFNPDPDKLDRSSAPKI